MSLATFSVFYYGFNITNENRFLSFREAATELIADIEVGDWTATELEVKIKAAMDLAGTQIYTVSFNRQSRTFTISAPLAFELLIATGTSGATVFPTLGFSGPDLTAQTTYTSNNRAGDAYEPQFILQDYSPSSHTQRLVSPAINKSATGRVEVVRFGVERLIKMNFKYVTDKIQDGRIIKNNQTGVEDAIRFFAFAIQKIPFEFMADENNKNSFETVLLESFPSSSDGTGFELRELYDQGLPGFYETGVFTLRKIEVL